MIFKDRNAAGKLLAKRLQKYKNTDSIVIGLTRGGVPVAYEIAQLLKLPLEVLVVRKLGAPDNPEYALGAVAGNGASYIDKLVIAQLSLDPKKLTSLAQKEIIEIARREKLYYHGSKRKDIKDKTVILVDDGIATGATVKAAVLALSKKNPKKIVLAVPVCPSEIIDDINQYVNDFICLKNIEQFHSVSQYFIDFPQVTDEEVIALLK